MAVTDAGTRLTALHREAQDKLRKATAADIVRLWDLLDPEAIDATELRWLRAVAPAVRERYLMSAQLSHQYLSAFRLLELGTPLPPPPPPVLATEQLTTALRVTGPVTIKRLTAQGYTPARAAATALTRVAGAASRLALAGGRRSLEEGIERDRRALGFQRVASGSACAFCAMLASRGPVYKTERTAGGDGHKYHDHCNCTVEPVYSRDTALPPSSARYRALYQEHAKGTEDPLNSLRRALSAGE